MGIGIYVQISKFVNILLSANLLVGTNLLLNTEEPAVIRKFVMIGKLVDYEEAKERRIRPQNT